MLGKFIKTTKKSIVLTVSGAFAVTAVAHAYQAEEQTYIIQGASPATISQLVENVGGEVIQNIELVNGVSASLTDNELSNLKGQNALLRFDNKENKNEVAGFVWGKLGPNKYKVQSNQTAGFVWGKLGPNKTGNKGKKFVESDDSKIAGFVWGKLGPNKTGKKGKKFVESDNSKIAGFVWGKLGPNKTGKKGKKFAESDSSKIAGFVWGKLGPNKVA